MAIRKEMVQINESGLCGPRFTHLNESEVSFVKGKIRRDVEFTITTNDGNPYDIEDQLADTQNALNSLLTIAEAFGLDLNTDAINKYKARQTEALIIKENHLT